MNRHIQELSGQTNTEIAYKVNELVDTLNKANQTVADIAETLDTLSPTDKLDAVIEKLQKLSDILEEV